MAEDLVFRARETIDQMMLDRGFTFEKEFDNKNVAFEMTYRKRALLILL